jgi:hypothetical protein
MGPFARRAFNEWEGAQRAAQRPAAVVADLEMAETLSVAQRAARVAPVVAEPHRHTLALTDDQILTLRAALRAQSYVMLHDWDDAGSDQVKALLVDIGAQLGAQ